MRRTVLVLTAALTLLFAVPAAAQASWGAIAVEPESGDYGVSSDYGSAAAAQHRAKQECGDPHCKVAAWVSNGYAALVLTKSGVYYAGIGRTENLARMKARQHAHDFKARYITSVFSGYS